MATYVSLGLFLMIHKLQTAIFPYCTECATVFHTNGVF